MSILDDGFNIDWGKVVQPVVEGAARAAVPAIVGNAGLRRVAAANQRASDIAGNAGDRALQLTTGAAAPAIQSINAGTTAAQERLKALKARNLDASAPAAAYLRQVVANGRNPNQLTPEQEQYLTQQRTQMMNGMDPSLRGSGQAYTSMVNQFDNNSRLPLISQNIQRADAAAGQLYGPGMAAANSADTGIANLAEGQGRDVAGITTGTASKGADIVRGVGDTQANAVTATGKAGADTMGSIGSFFANAANNSARDSRYGKFAYNN